MHSINLLLLQIAGILWGAWAARLLYFVVPPCPVKRRANKRSDLVPKFWVQMVCMWWLGDLWLACKIVTSGLVHLCVSRQGLKNVTGSGWWADWGNYCHFRVVGCRQSHVGWTCYQNSRSCEGHQPGKGSQGSLGCGRHKPWRSGYVRCQPEEEFKSSHTFMYAIVPALIQLWKPILKISIVRYLFVTTFCFVVYFFNYLINVIKL